MEQQAEPGVSMVGSGEAPLEEEEEGEEETGRGSPEQAPTGRDGIATGTPNSDFSGDEPSAGVPGIEELEEEGGDGGQRRGRRRQQHEQQRRRRRQWRKGREQQEQEDREPQPGSPEQSPPGQEQPPWPELRRPVQCSVYCVENDSPGDEGSPPDVPPPPPPADPLFPGLLETWIPLEPGGGWMVLACCRVCLEDRLLKPLPCCKKAVCEECLKRYLGSQVQLGQAEIKCPITECTEHLEETTILYYLPHDDIIKYKYFLELSRTDSSTKPCPQCKHFTTLKRKGHIPSPAKVENKFKIQCPSCQFVWCFKCHSPWHEGVNCKEYKKGDKLLRHWANEIEHGQRNAQKCPRCKIHIQRTEGCDHMTCSQCNTNFCYRCGERYRQLRFFGDHTSNLSIFGCKYRYLPEKPNLRRLVRGSVCAGKLFIAPLLIILGLALGAIAVVVGLFVFPVYCLCKKQRKRTQTGLPW